MKKIEIKDTEQLISLLYLKDELIHIYDELRFAKDINRRVLEKVRNRLKLLSETIDTYIKKSDNCFQIICLEDEYVEPQEIRNLKTNIIGYRLQDAEIIFDGSIPSAGYLELSYEDKDWGSNICVKNNMPRSALDTWDRGYHYNNPMTTRYFAPGVYQIDKGAVIGVVCTKEKELVRTIKKNNN